MKNRNIYSLKIIGLPKTLPSIYEGLKGINPVTKEEELICVDKFINKSSRKRNCSFKKECFYNIECDKTSSNKYLQYVFSSDLPIPISFIVKLSVSFRNYDFVLENKSSSDLNEKVRIIDGCVIAGNVNYRSRSFVGMEEE